MRILYVSDFDPAGEPMPLSVARKIEFMLADRDLVLDIQLRTVVLTPEQCRAYALPRTPIKKSESRKDAFEQRHGEGATELDALEANHPGELERILTKEILRYYDADLIEAHEAAADDVEAELRRISDRVHRRHAKDLKQLRAEYGRWAKQAKAVWQAITSELEVAAPDPDAFDWPEHRRRRGRRPAVRQLAQLSRPAGALPASSGQARLHGSERR